MSEQEKQENQKTIVAFAAGLLIGGLLVWVFGGTPKAESPEDINTATTTQQSGESDPTNATSTEGDDEEAPEEVVELQTGDSAVEVAGQEAGNVVALQSATFPNDEGWIGVRDYANGQLGGLLGVARFSKEQGLVPQQITLQRATRAGNTYAIVFYTESGDRVFSLADDVQIDGMVETFTATEQK